MDAKELMIGDWVLLNGEPKQVMEILFDTVTIDCYPIEEEYIEPIPLTPEILERNGIFKNPLMGEQRHFIYSLGGFELLAIYDINEGARKIKYVHELQHALRLCGIEKTIEL